MAHRYRSNAAIERVEVLLARLRGLRRLSDRSSRHRNLLLLLQASPAEHGQLPIGRSIAERGRRGHEPNRVDTQRYFHRWSPGRDALPRH